MKRNVFFLYFLFSAFFLKAQVGVLNIEEDAAVAKLMEIYINNNNTNTKIKGWTVVVTSTTERKVVEDQKQLFLNQFPEIFADWSHDKPYYKLKAGAFKKKSDALKLISQIKSSFPASYPAQDLLDISLFIEN